MYLKYRDENLCFGTGGQPLSQHLNDYSKPIYFYSRDILQHRIREYKKAFQNQLKIHYALKASHFAELLHVVKTEGVGLDVVSGGELGHGLKCGFQGSDIIFSGVAKTVVEIRKALEHRVFQLNVESPSELRRIGEIAHEMGLKAEVAFRMNPDVNPQTHPYITTGFRENKFGMDESFVPELLSILKLYPQNLSLVGLAMHIGSQIFAVDVFQEAIQKTKTLFLQLQSQFSTLCRFDIGGGLGISYESHEESEDLDLLQKYAQAVRSEFEGLSVKIHGEPGRWLVARAGVLVAQVQYIKKTPHKNFLILDTGMNHLLRPSLYSAYHRILPLKRQGPEVCYDVVGPICESSDVLAKDRLLSTLKEGDFVAIADVGAYGYSMASHYNLRDFPEQKVI